MRTRYSLAMILVTVVILIGVMTRAQQVGAATAPTRPQGPCDIYAAAAVPCAAAHSTTRALYAAYNGPLYQVVRQSDGKSLDIGVVQPTASPSADRGGYADAAAQDRFCANTYCWIAKIYDQSPKHNDLTQAPRGGFNGPALGGLNNVPIADMAPVSVMGHKVYGVFIEPGMGLRKDDAAGTAVDDQAEGQYWVINGAHFNSGCCFDYGNAEIDSRDDDNGTMETAYYGDATPWYHGTKVGPWIMTDQENNLVGCVNPDGSKLCATLPNITWRFVTAIAKGEPHHWTTLGGDAKAGPLSVMFDGPRVNATYDPMRKQGAILLGNGGDNSNSSQGTFYEGAITAAGTFPPDSVDQKVQANIVAAAYAEAPLSIAPASAVATPPGLQTFTPGSSQSTTVSFTNESGSPATGVELSLSVPSHWTSVIAGTKDTIRKFAEPVAPHASVSATFTVTSGPSDYNGDLVANASWTAAAGGSKQSANAAEKVRSIRKVRINEFRISAGPPANATDSFVELYNADTSSVDISNWTFTAHPTQQAIFSTIKIPAGTKLAAGGFYLLGLSNSGLVATAHKGDTTVHVRSISGMSIGDTVTIDNGAGEETRKIAAIGTAAANSTTVWQPLPDGPLTIPVGATNVPVSSVAGFAVGEKIALGYGAATPAVGGGVEKDEVVTVTAVGKPGTQAYLAADAAAGSTNLKVTSAANILAGDRIRLDIDSVGHGIENVTVTRVGTEAKHSNLSADAPAGAVNVKLRNTKSFAAGDSLIIGTPANHETVTITEAGTSGPSGTGISIQPALTRAHISDEGVIVTGTGLDLAAPLRFSHAANLPFSNRGTGISFQPASTFPHISNEPVRPLGTGISLDHPLSRDHAIDAVLRDASVTSAGYQGKTAPSQWFGGPEFSTNAPFFERTVNRREGSMVLRDAAGLVVDSLNYGLLVDPWAAQGYQATSGPEASGCYVVAPGPAGSFGPADAAIAFPTSAGRLPDGMDTGSNCADFVTTPGTALGIPVAAGKSNIKVTSVEGFNAGQLIRIDNGSNLETASIASTGTSGASTLTKATSAGATAIPVASPAGFSDGQQITIGDDSNAETAEITAIRRSSESVVIVSKPLAVAHAEGSNISGTGITLAAPLSKEHAQKAQVTGSLSTPGAANSYFRKAP